MSIFLLENLGTIIVNGNYYSMGLFVCSFCAKEFEKRIDCIKYCKSCGCVTKELKSKANKGKKRTLEQRKRYSDAFKGKPKSEEHKQNLSKAKKGIKRPEETRQKIRESMVGKFSGSKHPLYGKKGKDNPNFGSKRTEETKQKMGEANKGRIVSEETRQKKSEIQKIKVGVLSPAWQGGKSFEIYPQEFKRIKQFILKRDNYICQNINCSKESNKLDTHHIDFNKQNNDPENLTILCAKCHTKTNGKNNRQFWINYYKNKNKPLYQKNIIITGGMGLLGENFSKFLLANGGNIFVLDLQLKIDEKEKLKDIIYYGIDITKEEEIKKILNIIYKNYGHIDIIILCHAINPHPNKKENNNFENYSLDKWRETLDINLTSSFSFIQHSIKYMLKNNNEGFKGTIINISSDLGIITSDQSIYENNYIKPPDYGVSKAGLIHLTKYIAGYYRDKIKSVCLCPGGVYNGQSENLKKNLEDRIPIGRLARGEEYNEAIKFLCSSGSDYMQGNSLIMDGGRNIW